MRKLYTQEFIQRATALHKDLFTYEHTDLDHRDEKGRVIVTCRIHHDVLVHPATFLHQNPKKRSGCPLCKSRRYTNENVRQRAEAIYGKDKYDFSSIDVNNLDEKGRVKVICRTANHGEFPITINNLLKKGRKNCCPKCGKNCPYTNETFIDKANSVHNGKYRYPHLNFQGVDKEIRVWCPVEGHGLFSVLAKDHINSKSGCPLCNPAHKMSKEEFIERANKRHRFKYDYSAVNFVDGSTPVEIICRKKGHPHFMQDPGNHIQGAGCPTCRESKLERSVRNRLSDEKIEFVSQATFPDLKNKRKLPFDFYLPKFNVCIECQGTQHFKDVCIFQNDGGLKGLQERDEMKRKYCQSHGIRLLYFSDKHYSGNDIITSLDDLIEKIKASAPRN